jgi:hypothetical protein
VTALVACSGGGDDNKDKTGKPEAAHQDAAASPVVHANGPGTTSPPSKETVALVRGKSIEALLFTAPGGVADQAFGYFNELRQKSGGAVTVREVDRLTRPELAKRYRVLRPQTLVLVQGERFETMSLPARGRRGGAVLPTLDNRVRMLLTKLLRERVQVMVWSRTPMAPRDNVLGSVARILGMDIEQTRDIARIRAMAGKGVAVLLDPSAAESSALDAHVAAGGSALVALAPRKGAGLGTLGGRLGVRFSPIPVADDKRYARSKSAPSLADHYNLASNRFAPGPISTTARRAGKRSAAVVVRSGAFILRKGSRGQIALRSFDSAFEDANGNHRADRAEPRGERALVVTVAGDVPAYRVVLFGSTSWFQGTLLRGLPLNGAFLGDAIAWLAHAEGVLTRGPGAPPSKLVRYPARKAAPRRQPGTVWNERPDTVERIELRGKRRITVVEQRGTAWWARVTRKAPPSVGKDRVTEVELDARVAKLFDLVARPPHLGVLPRADDATRAAYGFDRGQVLEVTFESGTHRMRLGRRVHGGGDVYAEADGTLYVVAGRLRQALLAVQTRYRKRP